eukprot:m.213142 g.213142  ORF g.213142 m.213142 type:complete len:1878 (+) comp13789_c0_seq6:2376-8009(+)
MRTPFPQTLSFFLSFFFFFFLVLLLVSTMSFFEQGSRVWIRTNDTWCAGVAVSNDGTMSTFKTDNGEEFTFENDKLGPDVVSNMHQSSQDGVEDMALLSDLHEGSLLYNISLRFKADDIYTFIGSILSATNPYQRFNHLYGDEMMNKYFGKTIGELSPHIYAIANEVYHAMWKKNANQVVLISGESGAGKTESTKFILRFLSHVSNMKSPPSSTGKSYEEQIILSSPILEAFGNAKTVYNNNSSRFGKFIQLMFSSGGSIEGAKIIDYLLEKNRVVHQNKNERNFHVFYNLLNSGLDLSELHLVADPSKYNYTSQSGVWTAGGINDKEDWDRMQDAFTHLNFSNEQKEDINKMIAGILNLGNVTFENKGGAHVANFDQLERFCLLLGIEVDDVSEILTQQKRVLRGEEIFTPLDVGQASDSRDSLAMALYSRIFKWIIQKLNYVLKGEESFQFAGVLDIFGFENFEVNSLEQFNINYANEKLQSYFNRHIFSLEQLEYNKEGIDWSEIDWVDNADCLDLIERKLGVLSLLDEESRFPKGTDQSLLNKLHSSHGVSNDGPYIKPRMAVAQFGINHFAGAVMYNVGGFLEKNRDAFRPELVDVLCASSNEFLFDLFETMAEQQESQGTRRKKATVSYQFKESLHHLMSTLSQADPFFVRCLKPNVEKKPHIFHDEVVLNQLRYSGMLETVRIRRAGFPVRRVFNDFLFRYRVLSQGVDRTLPQNEQCAAVLKPYDEGSNWQTGSTKVFMRETLENKLEKDRHEKLKKTVAKICAVIMGHVQRKRYKKMRNDAIRIQAYMRMVLARKQYLKEKGAATKIQSVYRGHLARKLRAKLAEEKRIEEERLREEERRREEERVAELARLEAEAQAAAEAEEKEREEALRRLEEAKERQKEEARLRAEEEQRKKEEEERKLQEAKDRARVLEAEQKEKEEAARIKAEEAAKAEAEARALEEAETAQKKLEEERATELASIEAEQAEAEKAILAEQELEEAEAEVAIEDLYMEGALGMYRGVMQNLKRKWCVLSGDTFMYFKKEQDSIHAGFMTKIGGGTSTFGRKSWKRRWMALKGGKIHYYPTQDEKDELGVIEVQHCKEIIDEENIAGKEFVFGINTGKRTYLVHTESQEEKDEWLNILHLVKGKTDEEIQEMLNVARVNPRYAQGTLDLDDIVSASSANSMVEGRPTFAVMTTERVWKFVARNTEEMNKWIQALAPKKSQGEEDDTAVRERGWLMKAGGKANAFKRKRWFVLRGNVITYFRSASDELPISTIPLNSLCSVIPPDEAEAAKTGEWTFVVHSHLKSFHLTARTAGDSTRWIGAIQDVIDETHVPPRPMEQLVKELKLASPEEASQIYTSHKLLSYSHRPIPRSFLPLPYGEIQSPSSSRQYMTLEQEALRVSASLLPDVEGAPPLRYGRMGDPSKPVDLIKSVLQLCFDVPKIQSEVYCQLVCQTTRAPNPGSNLNMIHWYLFAAMCSSFQPARKFAKFIRLHLRNTIDRVDEVGEDVANTAGFCLDAMRKTKQRDFPPSSREIEAIMSGKTLTCTVFCVNGRQLELPISSSTTCKQIISQIKEELELTNSRNGFGLFETCGSLVKYLEEKYTVADVLSKWEKYEEYGLNPDGGNWRLTFKLFAFFDPFAPDLSDVEKDFLFEQAFENVLNGRHPADPQVHIKLAALRTQFVVGDYEDGAHMSSLVKVHPAQQPQVSSEAGGTGSTLKKAGTMIKGTLRGLGKGTLRRLRGGTIKKGEGSDAELKKINDKIVAEWSQMREMTPNECREAYMKIIRSWDGYGANLFEVTQTSQKEWPKELWLAINLEGVGIYPRGQPQRLAFFKYETVLSFGAPVSNQYKILVDGGTGAMKFETKMVLEIAKLMKEYIKAIVSQHA